MGSSVALAQWVLGVLTGQVGRSLHEILQVTCGLAFCWNPDQVNRNLIPLMPLSVSQSPHSSELWRSCLNNPGAAGDKQVSLAAPKTAGAECSLAALPFPLQVSSH